MGAATAPAAGPSRERGMEKGRRSGHCLRLRVLWPAYPSKRMIIFSVIVILTRAIHKDVYSKGELSLFF